MMTKALKLGLGMGLVLLATMAGVRAEDFTYTTNNGTITITGYTGSGGDVVIPDTINGLPVTVIGAEALKNQFSLTSIAIPDSVIDVGYWAFYGCSSLTNATFGGSVTTIGLDAFLFCYLLTSIDVAYENPIYSSVEGVLFSKDKTELILFPLGRGGSYAIPENVTAIGAKAFSSCRGLTGVILPDSVTEVGSGAFSHCRGLTNIVLGGSVSSIMDNVFAYCESLSSITLPDSVTRIRNHAFLSCYNLATITLPDSVTEIGDWAFSNCIGLTNVVLGGNVVSVGYLSFFGCSNLTTITLPDSVSSIGSYAFENCSALESVYFFGNAPTNGRSFYGAGPLTVYRVADATGWPSVPARWGGRPTALWDPAADLDGNSLPDGWDRRYFGDVGNDPQTICANGLNTLLEAYIAGLDPTAPQAFFAVEMAGQNILEWSGVSGRVYNVWWSTNLMDGFSCLSSNLPWSAQSYTDAVHGAEQECFYRLEVGLE